jgi:hypothetical protein
MYQQLTIGVEVPAGYEATGEFRWPKAGEPFLTNSGTASNSSANDVCGLSQNRIILRKLWSFPEWFGKGWWLYKNCHSSNWLVTDCEPSVHSIGSCMVGWQQAWPGSACITATELWQFHGEEFTPPSCERLKNLT